MEKIPVRHLRTTRQEPVLSESFSIRDVRALLAGKDLVQPLHRHDFFYVLALQTATGTHAIDFISYEVRDHSIFILRPGQVHQLALQAESTGYLLQFRADFYSPHDKIAPHRHGSQLVRKASTTNVYQPDAHRFTKLLALLTAIFEEYTNQQAGYQEVIQATLTIFFIELGRQHNQSSSLMGNPYVQERLDAFLALVETDMFTHKQVAHYADRMHLSPYQLNAITKATLGKTSSELLNESILLEAKRSLLATSTQVNQLADQLGYADASYFIRFFKKHTGYSPEAFRQNFR